jgi:NADH-quinone oxidoreductase subunit M
MTLLNLVLALPVAGFLIVLLMPREKPQAIRGVALVVALLTFVLSIGLAVGLRSDTPGAQFATDVIWIPSPEIHYHVGIDGLSLWLVLLSAFLTPIVVRSPGDSIDKRVKEFSAFLLLL